MTGFRINRLVVTGDKGCDYIFKPRLNIIQGYHDAGKTNLIEILRFSIGGKGKYIDSSIYNHFDYTYCEILLENEIYTIKRKKSRSGKKIEIINCSFDEIKDNSKWRKIETKDLSDLILSIYKIYGKYDRGRNLKPAQISFYQLFNLIYIPQRNWKGIQDKQQINIYDRIASFEFAIGISTEERRELTLKLRELNKIKENLGRRRNSFVSFLEEHILESPDVIQEKINNLQKEFQENNEKITNYKKEHEDRFKDVVNEYRLQLNNLALEYSQMEEQFLEVDNKITSLDNLKINIEDKIASISFSQEAYRTLYSIPFKHCPSCRQALEKSKEIKLCNLCKQPITNEFSQFEKEREVKYLKDTLNEVEYDISLNFKEMDIIEKRMNETIEKQNQLRNLIKKNLEIDTIPLIDNFQHLYDKKSLLQKNIEKNKALLKIWSYNKEISNQIENNNKEIRILDEKLKSTKPEMSREEKLKKFEEIYSDLLSNFSDIRVIEKVELSRENNESKYFPMINDSIYTSETGSAELIIRIIMYYLTFLILFKEGIAKFPSFLIIDTPRQQELTSGNYKKILELLSYHSKELQIIICVTEDVPLDLKDINLIKIEKGSHTIE